jgi:hypothetical protein
LFDAGAQLLANKSHSLVLLSIEDLWLSFGEETTKPIAMDTDVGVRSSRGILLVCQRQFN